MDVGTVLFMLPFVGVLLAAVAFIVGAFLMVRGPSMTRRLVGLALITFAGAATSYVAGWLSGFYILDPHEVCGVSPSEFVTIERHPLPVRQTCLLASGGTRELVPAWVNPAVFTLSMVCVASLVAVAVRSLPLAWRGRLRRQVHDPR